MSVLPRFRKPVDIVGLSDHSNIESWFASQSGLSYTNTYFDQPPTLDITEPTSSFLGKADILISSDVLEHVMYPMSRALQGHFNVLRPGGFLILTTPWVVEGPHIEHYPWMVSYTLGPQSGLDNFEVIGFDAKGHQRLISKPVFHGGPGKTLEMRMSSVYVLVHELSLAGFGEVEVRRTTNMEIGVFPWSDMGVIIACRPEEHNHDAQDHV